MGLPISVTEDDLKRIFGQHATPKAVRLVTFKTGKSRGFAYVEFSTEGLGWIEGGEKPNKDVVVEQMDIEVSRSTTD
uniref:RRM domain-containing protein n=1 Tax=Timema douglasi TaxID=61478 RepID=A0A7R8VWL7_TIMDO|nr:unnamed protein product [Timema douglasi]